MKKALKNNFWGETFSTNLHWQFFYTRNMISAYLMILYKVKSNIILGTTGNITSMFSQVGNRRGTFIDFEIFPTPIPEAY